MIILNTNERTKNKTIIKSTENNTEKSHNSNRHGKMTQ